MTTTSPRPSAARIALTLAGLLAALGAGTLVIGRVIQDFTATLILTGLWFGLVAVAALVLARRAPALRLPVLVTLGACAVLGSLGLWWTSFRDDVVDEQVATGVRPAPAAAGTPAIPTPAPPEPVNVERASGAFRSVAHETSGEAAVVELAEGGRVLTLTGLKTDNGPDLRVYLVPGGSDADGSVDGGVDLGKLKGNIGDQQYEIPDDVRLGADTAVVIWCRAFTVAFGVADLRRA
jgi:hypothetical protein